ncbi:MAG: hypothetical protein R3E87_12225 [Burkholderiaceae bacterium]
MDAGLALQIYEGLDRLAFGVCDAVAPLSDDLYDGLARAALGAKPRLHMIRNGVDLHEVESAPVGGEPIVPGRRRAGASSATSAS